MFVGVLFLVRHGFVMFLVIGRPVAAMQVRHITDQPVRDLFRQTVAILDRRQRGVWDQQPDIAAPLTEPLTSAQAPAPAAVL